MYSIATVIIGAGQAGLALSRCLTAAGHDHVLLDRGRLAERWRSERWDSLRLLTPNWMTRLPGWWYSGSDPDGFMTAAELVDLLERYAASFGAPVHTGVTVESVEPTPDGYVVATDAGTWRCSSVVIATGAADVPAVPTIAAELPAGVEQLVPSRYRNPADLADGGVLVVGAGASGLQIADELARAGRHVVLAVGSHTRMPRSYRGRDIFWWMDRTGALDQRVEEVPDPEASRRAPSMQLIGGADRADLDLAVARTHGVELVGHLVDAGADTVTFADDLARTTAKAHERMTRVLDRIDASIADSGLDGRVPSADRPRPLRIGSGRTSLRFRREAIGTVVWAIGYRQAHPWLRIPGAVGPCGLRQFEGAVLGTDGLYVLGLRFQTRRSSNFIDGVGHDARLVADQILRRCRHAGAVSTVKTA